MATMSKTRREELRQMVKTATENGQDLNTLVNDLHKEGKQDDGVYVADLVYLYKLCPRGRRVFSEHYRVTSSGAHVYEFFVAGQDDDSIRRITGLMLAVGCGKRTSDEKLAAHGSRADVVEQLACILYDDNNALISDRLD